MTGGVYVIGVSIEGADPVTFSRALHEPEAPFLESTFQALYDRIDKIGQPRELRWIGWHIIGFDIPFLAKRCVIGDVRPKLRIPTGVRYNNNFVCDLMLEWSGFKDFKKQRDVATACGIEVPSDLDGKQLWEHGVDAAAEKCRSDIAVLIAIHQRMKAVYRV